MISYSRRTDSGEEQDADRNETERVKEKTMIHVNLNEQSSIYTGI